MSHIPVSLRCLITRWRSFKNRILQLTDQHVMTGSGSDNRDPHHNFIERPRSSCEMPRVPGIKYVYLSLLIFVILNYYKKKIFKKLFHLFTFFINLQLHFIYITFQINYIYKIIIFLSNGKDSARVSFDWIHNQCYVTFLPWHIYREIKFDKTRVCFFSFIFISRQFSNPREIFRFSIYPSSQPPGQQIPIGNNTGSLPDLSNVHFPSPLHTPLDQEDHSSSTPFSNVSSLDRLSHTIDYIYKITFSIFLSARFYTHFTRGCTFLNESLSLLQRRFFFLFFYILIYLWLSLSRRKYLSNDESETDNALYRTVCASVNNTINTHLLSARARVCIHRYVPPRDFARVK